MRLNLFSLACSLAITFKQGNALPMMDGTLSKVTSVFGTRSARSVQTCADPSLAQTIYQAYASLLTAHVINFHYAFVTADTAQGPEEAVRFSMQGAVFKGWPTQQPFTVPLFALGDPTGTDLVYMVGPDSQTPPVVSGFSAGGIIVWVYDTPVCGSVPLMSAVFAAQTDHYYTTNPNEHAGLLADGWSDSGVVAFVLPLPPS